MVSLTTVYVISVILTSLAGMGASFATSKFVGGGEPVPVPEISPPAPVPEEPVPEPTPQPSTEQTLPASPSEVVE